MKKKAIWIKILEISMQVVPITLFCIMKRSMFVQSVPQTIGLGLIMVLITLFLIFKDAVRRFYQTPGAFKFVFTIFIISGLGALVGLTFFILSCVELVFIILSIPVQIWYNYVTRPATADDVVSALNDIINSKKGE